MKRLIHGFLLGTACFGFACCAHSATASELERAAFPDGTANGKNAASLSSAADEQEKLTIKTIMKLAHKSGLLKKVATGKSTAEETAQLLEYYTAMPDLKPPRGAEESWQEKTEALVAAAKAAADNAPNAGNLLKTSTNCAACHDIHK